jgi:hypothetical protein
MAWQLSTNNININTWTTSPIAHNLIRGDHNKRRKLTVLIHPPTKIPKLRSIPNMEITPIHLSYALLTTYCLCGCLLEHLALFHAWTLATNANDLFAMQVSSGTRAGIIYVVPKMVLTFQAIYIALQGPSQLVPGAWWSVGFLMVTWISAALIQVPMQLRLRASKGKDRAALERLLATTWVRTAGMLGHCVVVGYGLFVLRF